MKPFFIFLFSVVSVFLCAQQSLTFRHIDERQGLTANNFHTFYTDSRGLLWIGSNSEGLYTFDGYQCTNRSVFQMDSGSYHMQSISNITEDKQGNLWIGELAGTICYHRATDKMSYHVFYANQAHNGKHYSDPFYIDDKNRLWDFICDQSSLSTIDLNSPALTRNMITELGNGFYCAPNKKNFESLKAVVGNMANGFAYLQLSPDTRVLKTEYHLYENDKNEPSGINVNAVFFLNDSILYLCTNKGLIKYNRISRKAIFYTEWEEDKITKLNCVQSDGKQLFLGTQENGLLIFDLKKEKYVQQFLHDASNPFSISGNYVQAIHIDKAGNLFLGISGSGVDYCNIKESKLNAQYSENIPEKKRQAISFASFSTFQNQEILAGTNEHGLLLLDATKTIVQTWTKENSTLASNHVNALFRVSDNSTLVGTTMGVSIFNHTTKTIAPLAIPHSATNPSVNYIARINEHEIGISTEDGFFVLDENLKLIHSLDILNRQNYTRYQSFYSIAADELLVNTDYSYLLLLKKENGAWKIKQQIENYASVYGYLLSNKKKLWMATSKGLQQLDLEKFTFITLSFPVDIQCYSIFQADSFLWMSSNKGLIRYQPTTQQFQLFDEQQNVLNKGYNPFAAILSADGEIILGGKKGINFFYPKSFEPLFFPLKPLLKNILVNDIPFAFDSNINESTSLTFPYSQNTLSFQFSSINYGSNDACTMSYFLEGYDKTPVNTTGQGNVRYARLPAGDYVFRLRSFSKNNPKSVSEKAIAIHITPPFYQTWWFRLLAIACVGGSIYAVFRYRIHQIRKEEKQKTSYNIQLAEMESRALRSQMNPHFIFNSLNSIQRYIFQNDVEKSSNYLTRFARLMRQILENSKHSFILLEEELDSLETYIELEKMRFEKQFFYTIKIAQDIEVAHIFVPPLLLQPYVENAIWHGLMHKETEGKLNIAISQTKEQLQIVIADDGIGRKAAALMKTKLPNHHQSTAIKATEERLLLIERTMGRKVSVKIVDLENENGLSSGTQVIITMPLIEEN